LDQHEWQELGDAIKRTTRLISEVDLEAIYKKMLENPVSDISLRFLEKALARPRLKTKPGAYNYGVNEGRAAGRTVDHLHLHIIPRFVGDVADPRGGVRYVIPEMGNYKELRG